MYNQRHNPYEKIDEEVDIKKAFEKAEEILGRDEIKLEEFERLYGSDTIQRDTEYVAKRKRKFEQSATPAEKSAGLSQDIRGHYWLMDK